MDHCPPKQLYQRPLPKNLRTVPCCSDCNKKFKADEEYLNYLMARIALNPELKARLQEDGSVTKLMRRQEHFKGMLDGADHGDSVDVDNTRLETVAGKLSMGLYYLHYGKYPCTPQLTRVFPFNGERKIPPEFFELLFAKRELSFSSPLYFNPADAIPYHLRPDLWGDLPKRWHVIQENIMYSLFVKNPNFRNWTCCVFLAMDSLISFSHFPYPSSLHKKSDAKSQSELPEI